MIDEEKADLALTLLEDIAYELINSEDDEVIESELEELGPPRDTPGGRFGRPAPTGPAAILRLYVAPSEIAQIIGRQGRTAQSLRVILNAVGQRHGQRYMVEIVEQGGSDEPGDATRGNFNR